MSHLADETWTPSPINATMRVGRDGTVRADPVRYKIAILGGAAGRDEAPYDDPDWEIWSCNLIPALDQRGRFRADRWFDLHQRVAQSPDDLRWIAKCPCPIYLPDDLADASRRRVRYPIETVEAAFGGYWACTFAYQIALALTIPATDIGLFGINLAIGTIRERTVEWANVSWWIGYAEGRGVNIHIPASTSLGQHPFRYGLEYEEERDAVLRYERRTIERAQVEHVQRAYDAMKGKVSA